MSGTASELDGGVPHDPGAGPPPVEGTADASRAEAAAPDTAALSDPPEAPPAPADPEPERGPFATWRTARAWSARPVSDETLRELHHRLSLGPTSGNCSPARFAFLRGEEAKERLARIASAGNAGRIRSAPVVAIVASDPFFYEHLGRLSAEPHAREWFAHDPEFAEATARRNATLQGAWLIVAAHGLDLVCGPMSGFDNARVDAAFLAAEGWRSDFIVCLGHPADAGTDPVAPAPRAPRLGFDEACRLL